MQRLVNSLNINLEWTFSNNNNVLLHPMYVQSKNKSCCCCCCYWVNGFVIEVAAIPQYFRNEMEYKKRTSSILCCKIFAVEMANGILLSIYKELVENRCLFARQNGVIDCDSFHFLQFLYCWVLLWNFLCTHFVWLDLQFDNFTLHIS